MTSDDGIGTWTWYVKVALATGVFWLFSRDYGWLARRWRARRLMPPIGVPRVYTTAILPVLYPGERASPHPIALADLIAASARGEASAASGWIVEPAPGWHALWLRWYFRCVGRWLPGDAPKLDVAIAIREDTDA